MKKICVCLAIVSSLLSLGFNRMLAEDKKQPDQPSFAFVTYILDGNQEYAAEMLVNSIRKWGGEYGSCPIYVVLTGPDATGFRLKNKNVELISLPLSESIRNYPFAAKAFAAAKVEEMTSGKIRTLAWFDPEAVLLNPPRELDLKEGAAAAVAPVHFLNTGQSENEPVDAFWAPIYKRCGLDLKKLFNVETMVDCRKVRAWLNCGMFSVRPERGLFREWAKILDEFMNDKEYQRTAISDIIHRIFLHQAVISTLIVSRLEQNEIHMLPSNYNYPLFCHSIPFSPLSGGTFTIPPHKKAQKLNDLTSVFIERLFSEHPDWIKYIPPADEPLKTWLLDQYYNSLKVTDRIYREENSCNSYLVITSKGSVLIDPGGAAAPESAIRQLSQKSPVQAILLTHAHQDHIEGIESWTKDKKIPVIGQREMVEFMRYNGRLDGFLSRRLAMQTGAPIPQGNVQKPETLVPATILFNDQYQYKKGGLHFEMFHVGGETPDQSVIWIPELKAAFIGDNYYASFPNLYTLRGTAPRWALDYIKALEKALSLEPEVLMPGHGEPIVGKEMVQRKLTEYRDAIREVHDAVVKGMNEGKDVYTLMREIKLPEKYKIQQFFGRVSWSVRGIYEGYVGWFDENPATMYDLQPSSIYSDLVQLSGGPDAVIKKAGELLKTGDDVRALRMSEAALAFDPANKSALEAKWTALRSLRSKTGNYIEINWLNYGIIQTVRQLDQIINDTFSVDGFNSLEQKYGSMKTDCAFWNTSRTLNRLGNNLVKAQKLEEAIKVSKLNAQLFPNEAAVYDSLGEAYMKNGNKDLAIENYEKSLKLNPQAANTIERLKELREGSSDLPKLTGPYLGQKPPGTTPEIFAPGVISYGFHEHGIAISPNGNEIFFVAASSDFSKYMIMQTKLENGNWSMPSVAPFSGRYTDLSPTFSPDGNRLYFSSKRPLADNGETKNDFDIWFVERSGNSWTALKNIGNPVNTPGNETNPSFMSDGTMVFQYIEKLGSLKWDIYIAHIKDGLYTTPQPLPAPVNTENNEAGPFIAPDGSYLLFNTNRNNHPNIMDIYITFKTKDRSWTEPVRAIPKASKYFGEWGPVVSPDGKHIFFSSFRNVEPIEPKFKAYLEAMKNLLGLPQPGKGTIYWTDAKIIEELKLEKNSDI